MVGPSLGGWLYEIGGIRAAVPRRRGAGARRRRSDSLWLDLPPPRAAREPVPLGVGAARRRPVARLRGRGRRRSSATISMLEPVLPLFLDRQLGLGPARIGLLFGVARRRVDACCTRSTAGWPTAGAAGA